MSPQSLSRVASASCGCEFFDVPVIIIREADPFVLDSLALAPAPLVAVGRERTESAIFLEDLRELCHRAFEDRFRVVALFMPHVYQHRSSVAS